MAGYVVDFNKPIPVSHVPDYPRDYCYAGLNRSEGEQFLGKFLVIKDEKFAFENGKVRRANLGMGIKDEFVIRVECESTPDKINIIVKIVKEIADLQKQLGIKMAELAGLTSMGGFRQTKRRYAKKQRKTKHRIRR